MTGPNKVIFLKCLLGFHSPVRSEVVREPSGYAGQCKGCGKSIRRLRRGRWVIKPQSRKSA